MCKTQIRFFRRKRQTLIVYIFADYRFGGDFTSRFVSQRVLEYNGRGGGHLRICIIHISKGVMQQKQ